MSNLGRFSASPPVALATTSASDHGLQTGDRVKIASATAPSQYKGVFLITDVPALNQFKYALATDPGPASYTDATYQKVFGTGNVLIEGNVIELAPGGSAEIAVHVHDGKNDATPDSSVDTPAYVHTEVVVRNNKIRYLNGEFDASFTGTGVRVSGTKNAIIRDNVVESAQPNPNKDFRCGTVKYTNNKTPAGALIQGYNGVTNEKYSELETEAEDALVLSLI